MEVSGSAATALRRALRALRSRKAFSAAAVLTLSLAIGATSTVFSAFYAVLLAPLPFKAPDRIVIVSEHTPTTNNGLVAPLSYLRWQDDPAVFEQVAAFTWWESSRLDRNGVQHPVLRIRTTPNYFLVLGAQPLLGRTFTLKPGAKSPEAILSHEIWMRHFDGDPSIVGRQVRLDGAALTVVGVMPSGYTDAGIGWGHIWTISRVDPVYASKNVTPYRFLRVIGRLQPGLTADAAQGRLRTIQRQLQKEVPRLGTAYEVSVRSLQDTAIGRIRPALTVMMGAVVFVLLAACTIVTSLFLARFTERTKEFATLLALGARVDHLVWLVAAESAVLAILGGAGGLALTYAATQLVRTLQPALPRVAEIVVTWPVVWFTLAVVLLACVLISVVPTLALFGLRRSSRLNDTTRAATPGLWQQRVRRGLLFAQVSLTVLLMVAAGEFIRSTIALLRINPGFEAGRALVFDLTVYGPRYEDRERLTAFYQDLLQRLATLPGSEAAGTIRYFPYRSRFWTTPVYVDGSGVPPDDAPVVHWNLVGGDYFRAMGIPLMRGRLYTEHEVWRTGDVVVINERMAAVVFGDGDPIGRRIRESAGGPPLTVVGVVGDVRQRGLDVPSEPEMYLPYAALTSELSGIATVVIRARGNHADVAAAIQREIARIDPTLRTASLSPLAEYVEDTVATREFVVGVLSVFAGLALALAAAGVYGTLSYMVMQRRTEIGVRMAIGARPSSIVGLIASDALWTTMLGAVVGLAGGVAVMRGVSRYFFGLGGLEVVTYLVVPLLVAVVTLAAAFSPAMRAARTDPALALRTE